MEMTIINILQLCLAKCLFKSRVEKNPYYQDFKKQNISTSSKINSSSGEH